MLFTSLTYSQEELYINTITKDPQIRFLLTIAINQTSYLEDYNAAIKTFEKALQIAGDKNGKESQEYAKILMFYAQCFQYKGSYDSALEHGLHAYELIKEDLNPNDILHIKALSDLAACYHHIYEYENALTFYLKAVDLRDRADKTKVDHYSMVLNNLATLYDDIGQTEKAIYFYNKALKAANAGEGLSTTKISTLHNLALIYNRIEDYNKSFELINESLKLSQSFLGSDNSMYFTSLNILAINFQDTGQYEKAFENFSKAQTKIGEILGKEHLGYAKVLVNLGRLKVKTNETKEAIGYLTDALKIIEKQIGKNNLNYRGALLDLAMIYKSKEEYKSAYPLLEEYNTITLNQIKDNFIYQTAKEKQEFIIRAIGKDGLNHIANYNYLTNNSNDKAVSLALNNILTSKGLVLSATKDLLSDLKGLNNTSLNDSIVKFIEKRRYITKQLQLPIIKRSITLKKVQEEVGNLERVLVNNHKKYFKSQGDYVKDYRKTKLKDKDIAIEFTHFNLYDKKWTGDIRYAAYIYRKGWKTPKVINLFEEKELKEYFEKYTSRGAIASSNKTNEKVSVSEFLYELIWQPLEPHLKDVETIYYSPDGLLHKVPINALPNNEGRFLGELYNLNRVSNTARINTQKKFPDLDDVMLLGDITYDYDKSNTTIKNESSKNSILKSKSLLGNEGNKKRNARSGSWTHLPGTKREIEFIKEQLPKSEVLRKTDATETAFKQLSGKSPSILHVSTHGFFFPDAEDEKKLQNNQTYTLLRDPLLRSGLILANANYAWKNGSNPYEKDDGILTALEISHLDLRKTDIVILSACDTGLGDIPSSEGVYGLQRAFKMAGVNSIIMTLWEVPDKETAEFMKKFYTKWKSTNNAKVSFKYAQKFMMKRYRFQVDKWAAFVFFE